MSKLMRAEQNKLDKYYKEVTSIILSRQNGASGLIPASVAVSSHGDYRDAWVRDNVYSILAVWGLALAYRRLDDDQGRAYELEHATIKCMRGLLFSMMRQVGKVEQFKKTQSLLHCLHAKYNTETGSTVVADNAWGHLQIDATSLFLLSLAQMTVSGLHIIYTLDEVQFIQNLVFYIERGYRTPDYGIWERGNKTNHGTPELNCSSIGMVVAALQAINGINLFGSRGGSSSVIHVLPDEIIRNYMTLHSALPRESPSKEIDAALLAVISFPAFAVADKALADRTRSDIIKKLGGKYGCKRFLRDGHQTVLEDASRLHYDPHELKIFEDVESEWPLFFTYLILDGLFNNDAKQVKKYRDLLEPCLVDSIPDPDTREIFKLVPELFIVPADKIAAEKKNPGSQKRIPNENVPLVWAQSLFILGNLINEDLLSTADIDPLALRNSSQKQRAHADTVVQIVLISDSLELQQKLLMYGLETQTVENCEPITISKPSCLRDAFSYLGANKKLGLSGRPDRPIGTLSSCKIYRCQGRLYAFLPHFMDREEFYLVSDNNYLVSLFEQEIASLRNHWMQTGRPTMVVILNNQMLGNIDRDDARFKDQDSGKRNILNFLISIKSTQVCNGTRVRVGRLSEMVNTACLESLDFLVTSKASKFDLILKGNREGAEVSKLHHSGDADSNLRKRNSVHRFVRPEEGGGALSPLTKSLGNSPALEVFALQEDVQNRNDTTDDGPLLSVTFGNPEHALAAIELLRTTISLFDQIDLLHYLFSCYGGSYFILGLATVNDLLEEVYAKAMQFKLWSIVRTAAGILKKNVNSLTSNLADLLIRQKTVSVGLRPKEYFITAPQNPHDLSKIIYEYCSNDIREGPLIQELITYMGSLIRSSPQLFNGIMRIRTHFFLIAMREEISRGMRCHEEDAIEHLFRLSPYEIKSLLQQVLVAHEQVESFQLSNSNFNLTQQNHQPLKPTRSLNSLGNELKISCQSGGFNAGNFANIEILRDGVLIRVPMISGRGLNMIAIDPYDGQIVASLNFDIHYSRNEGHHFAKHIEHLNPGTIVVVVAKDDFIENMSEAAYAAIESLGASQIRNAKYRDSYCLIGEKGASPGSVPESHHQALMGPTEILTKTFELMQPQGLLSRKGNLFAAILPSNGWWVRRRRNDGALNRVPPNFYPKVWRLLSKTARIKIGDAALNSFPIISESTPEELNFAFQVENLLNNIIDPAEHQIAVECLVVISRIDERNPELILTSEGFDLQFLIQKTIERFWKCWVEEQTSENSPINNDPEMLKKVIESASHSPLAKLDQATVQSGMPVARSSTSPLHAKFDNEIKETKEGSDLSFENNEKVARRIFFDVRQDGLKGTMSYLASTCVRNVFSVAFETNMQNKSS